MAQSTYGGRPGEGIGDLSVLYGLETGLRAQAIPAAVIRCAYLMSNWDAALGPARERGELPTMYPAELRIPMVAPADIGRLAADLLVGEGGTDRPTYAEGPERYSSVEAAVAFGQALGHDVAPVVTPRDGLEPAFRGLGFSEAAARSYARMTAAGIDEGFEQPLRPWRGAVTIDAYVRDLVERTSSMP
ncbi:hypothetical protein [Methylobacterium sp. sgz302541]|uniref:hypothetical protein n=1 Tax=unclassified Methylobacterium TaxID=2615210 RepID=UPI003D3503D1